jgi:hypothetical protein
MFKFCFDVREKSILYDVILFKKYSLLFKNEDFVK